MDNIKKRKLASSLAFDNGCTNVKFELIPGKLRLFEMPKTMNVVSNNFCILGSENEDAVLCDKDGVYSIKKVDSSTKIFVLSGDDVNIRQIDIVGATQHYYEVSSIIIIFIHFIVNYV